MSCQVKQNLVLPDDPELKKCFKVSFILIEINILEVLEKRVSSWNKMKRIAAWLLKYKRILMTKMRRNANLTEDSALDDNVLKEAETVITEMEQNKRFADEVKVLRGDSSSNDKKRLRGSYKIAKLDHFVDEKSILCIGGRLQKSLLGHNCKHPVLLSKKESVITDYRLVSFPMCSWTIRIIT